MSCARASRSGTMALLVLDRVSKHGRGGARQQFALRDVSFELDAAELVAVWGLPRSGRSTLVQVAGGVVPPSAGTVRFDGRDITETPALGRSAGIALVNTCFRRVIGDSVLEHVAAPFMGRGMATLPAQSKAIQVLRRVDAVACAELDADDLDHTEAIRVGIARALATDPRLLLLDDPTIGVPPARDRDDILTLLRSIAHRDRIAVLMTVGDAADLAGVDRALTIDNGTLRGPLRPEPAQVIALRPEQGGSTA